MLWIWCPRNRVSDNHRSSNGSISDSLIVQVWELTSHKIDKSEQTYAEFYPVMFQILHGVYYKNSWLPLKYLNLNENKNRLTVGITNLTLRFAGVDHQDFLHLTIIQIIQFSDGSLCSPYQVGQDRRRPHSRHKLMLQNEKCRINMIIYHKPQTRTFSFIINPIQSVVM